jgi:hypothetical protein
MRIDWGSCYRLALQIVTLTSAAYRTFINPSSAPWKGFYTKNFLKGSQKSQNLYFMRNVRHYCLKRLFRDFRKNRAFWPILCTSFLCRIKKMVVVNPLSGIANGSGTQFLENALGCSINRLLRGKSKRLSQLGK